MAYNEIKLVAIDLDGTLLKSPTKLSDANIGAVHKIQNHGIKVILATGRNPFNTIKFAKQLKIHDHSETVICYNGAQILTYNNEDHYKIIKTTYVKFEILKFILELCKKYSQVNLVFFGDDSEKLYTYKRNIITLTIAKYQHRKLEKIALPIDSNFKLIKFTFFASESNLEKVYSELVNKFGDDLNIYWSNLRNNFECTDINASKLKAVQYIASLYKLSENNIMALGDGENDQDLLKWAKYGVAMANATEKIKKSAKFTTEKTNTKDGVSIALNKFCLD